jgi:hypothetical protein
MPSSLLASLAVAESSGATPADTVTETSVAATADAVPETSVAEAPGMSAVEILPPHELWEA